MQKYLSYDNHPVPLKITLTIKVYAKYRPSSARLFTHGEGKALGKLKVHDGLTVQSDSD